MKHSRRLALSRATFSGFLLSMLSLTPGEAAPTGGQVARGSATFQQSGNVTTIRASNGAVINYTGFDIGKGETVNFIQPGSSSRVLNRVNSSDPTRIFGQLDANGIVYLINPNGIYFQNGSMLNVGHLYAAAGHLSDTDFLTGKNHFSDLTGDVMNSGQIMAGGSIHLFGEHVANFGSIASQKGVVVMTAGSDVLVGPRDSHIFVRANPQSAPVAGAAPGVQNAGRIQAPRAIMGAGDLYSVAISNTGVIKSRQIALDGGKTGAVNVSGTLDASSAAPQGTGGRITVTGQNVALQGATLNASGARGGGTVMVGGGFHGQGPLPPAQHTTMDAASVIKADATVNGSGGKVVLWSQQSTDFRGTISAVGAHTPGAPGHTAAAEGGTAEVSSKGVLGFTGLVSLAGANGGSGHLLLDPTSITIATPGANFPPALTPLTTVDFPDTPLAMIISPVSLDAALLNATVTLRATDDITVKESVLGLAGGNLVLQAGHSILFGSGAAVSVTLSGSLTATAHDPGTTPVGVATNPLISMVAGSSINTSAPGSAVTLTNSGGAIQLATVNAGAAAGSVVTLSASGAVTQTGALIARSVQLHGATGTSYALNNSGNSVALLASDANGAVTFTNSTNLTVDTGGIANTANATIGLAVGGTLNLTGAISNGTGTVRLESNGNLTQTAAGTITTGTLGVRNDSTTAGRIELTGANSFQTVAGRNAFSAGNLLVSSTGAVTVGTVTVGAGAAFTATTGLTLTGAANLFVHAGGNLTLTQAITASLGSVYLVANGNVTQTGVINTTTLGVRNESLSTGAITLNGANTFNTFAAASLNALSGPIVLVTGASAPAPAVTHLLAFNGTGGGTLFGDTNGVSTAGNTDISIGSGSTLTLNAPVSAGSGTVRLLSAGAIGQSAAGIITAGGLAAFSNTSGNINLGVAANVLGTAGTAGLLAAKTTGAGATVTVKGTNGITVGTILAGTNFTFAQLSGITTAAGAVILNSGGTLTLQQNITATGANVSLTGAQTVTESGGAVVATGLAVTAGNTPTLLGSNTFTTIAAKINNAGQAFTYALPTGTLTVSTVSVAGVPDVVGVTTTNGDVNLTATSGNLTLAQNITAGTGTVNLRASGTVSETTGAVTSGALSIGAANSVALTQANAVGTLAATLTGAGSSFYFSNVGAYSVGDVGLTMGIHTLNGDIGLQSGGSLLLSDVVSAGSGTVRLVSHGNLSVTGNGGVAAAALGARNDSTVGGDITLNTGLQLGGPVAPGLFAAGNAFAGGTIAAANNVLTGLQINMIGAPAAPVAGFTFNSTTGVSTTGGGAASNDIRLTAVGTLDLAQNVSAPGANVLLSASQLVKESSGLVFSSGPTQAKGLAIVSAQTPQLLNGNAFTSLAAQITSAGQSFSYTSPAALKVDNVLSVPGVNTNGGAITLETTTGALTLNAAVNSKGAPVQLFSDADAVLETGPGAVIAGSLSVQAVKSSELAGANAVPLLAANVSGAGADFTFANTTGLTVGFVGGLHGLTNSGTGDLNLQVGGTLQLSDTVNAGTGNVRLGSQGSLFQNATGVITATRLTVRNDSAVLGAIDLPFDNQISTLAAANAFATGAITVVNVGVTALSIGSDAGLTAGTNFKFNATGGLSASGVSVIGVQTAGSLSVDAPIVAASGTVLLSTAGDIGQTGTGTITASTAGLENTSTTGGAIVLKLANKIAHLAASNAYASGEIAINDRGASALQITTVGSVSDNHFQFQPIVGVSTVNNQDIGLASGGSLAIDRAIDAGTGTVRLVSSGDITQATGVTIAAGTLGARNESTTTGNIALALGAQIGTVAASNAAAGKSILLDSTNPSGLILGLVTAPAGGTFTFADTIGLNAPAGSALLVVNGGLSQAAPLHVHTLGVRNESGAGTSILLTLANVIDQVAAFNAAAGEITILGGGAGGLTVTTVPQTSISSGLVFAATDGVQSSLNGAIGLVSSGSLALDRGVNAGGGIVRLVSHGAVTQMTALQAGSLSVEDLGATLSDITLQGANVFNTLAVNNTTAGGKVLVSSANTTPITVGTVVGQVDPLFSFDPVVGVTSTTAGAPVSPSTVHLTSLGDIVLAANVQAPGADASFTSTTGTLTETAGRIMSYGLALRLASSPNLAPVGNSFNVLAAKLTASGQSFTYTQAGSISVGTADLLDGVTTVDGAVSLTSVNGNISLAKDINSGKGDTLLSALAGTISETAGGAGVKAGGLAVKSLLTPTLTGQNVITRLAAVVTGAGADFNYSQAGSYVVDTVQGVAGITAPHAVHLITLGQIGEHTVGIVAPILDIRSGTGDQLNGANSVAQFTLLNSAGHDVSFSDLSALAIGATGVVNQAAGNITLASTGTMTLAGMVDATNGDVSLSSGNLLTQTALGLITAHKLTTQSLQGTTLRQANAVSTFEGQDSFGGIDFRSAGPLTVSGATELFKNIVIASNQTLRTTGPISARGSISLLATGSETIGDSLTSTGNGSIILAPTGPHSNVTVQGDVNTGGAFQVTATGDAQLTKGVSAGSIAVTAQNIEIDDASANSGDLTLQAANDLYLTGTSYSGRNVLLNADPAHQRAPSPLASIIFTSSDQVTVNAQDAYTVGYLQNTVANGSLTINAGTASLGDTAARDALTVTADQIILLDRQPNGSDFQGRHDSGLNFVAQTIDFGGSSVQFSGQGNGRAYFSVASGLPNVQRGDGLSFFVDSQLDDQFQEGLDAPNGRFVAATALPVQPLVGGSVDAEVVAALAGALPELHPPQGSAEPQLSAATVAKLLSLGVSARDPDAEEKRGIKARRALFKQLIAKTMPADTDYKVVVNRIAPGQVENVLATYDRILGPKQELKPNIEKLLSGAYAKYVEKTSADDASGFGAWLVQSQAKDPQARNSLAIIGQFRQLFTQLGKIGLTPKEVSISEDVVARSLEIDGLSPDDFLNLVGTPHHQPPPAAPAPAPAAPPTPSPAPQPQAENGEPVLAPS